MSAQEASDREIRCLIGTLVGKEIQTLGPSRRTNRIVALTGDVVQIETAKSAQEGTEPTVPVEWFVAGWEILKRDGYLERSNLPDPMTHRSAAVFAILSQHPCVDEASREPIRLELDRGCLDQSSTLNP